MTMEILSSRLLLRPSDLRRSVAFYRDVVGLHPYREFGSKDAGGVVFFLGGGFLEMSGRGPEEGASETTQLWLQVREVDAVAAHLEARGVTIDEPPSDKPWGLREMAVRDPDGLRLVFVEVPEDHPLRRDVRG